MFCFFRIPQVKLTLLCLLALCLADRYILGNPSFRPGDILGPAQGYTAPARSLGIALLALFLTVRWFDFADWPRFVKASLLFVILAFSAYLPFLFLTDAATFDRWAQENVFLENISAELLILGALLFLGLAIYAFKKKLPLLVPGLCLLASGVALVIGLEEISWGQRLTGIETPELFAANLQGETNIHNFFTHVFEGAYYTGAFLFFVLLPFAYDKSKQVAAALSKVALFIPGRWIVFASAIAFAYNWNNYEILHIQITLFFTLFILMGYLWESVRNGLTMEGVYLGALLLVFSLSQALFYEKGELLPRSWALTEYKEFFIALALFLYALDVTFRITRLPAKS